MDFEKKEKGIEQDRQIFKIKALIFDALFICGIENDKIPSELKVELNRIVEELIPDDTSQLQAEIQPTTDKLSITRETIETLHMHVMKAITDNLTQLGITDTQKLDLLSNVVLKIIQCEKEHRDKETERSK